MENKTHMSHDNHDSHDFWGPDSPWSRPNVLRFLLFAWVGHVKGLKSQRVWKIHGDMRPLASATQGMLLLSSPWQSSVPRSETFPPANNFKKAAIEKISSSILKPVSPCHWELRPLAAIHKHVVDCIHPPFSRLIPCLNGVSLNSSSKALIGRLATRNDW